MNTKQHLTRMRQRNVSRLKELTKEEYEFFYGNIRSSAIAANLIRMLKNGADASTCVGQSMERTLVRLLGYELKPIVLWHADRLSEYPYPQYSQGRTVCGLRSDDPDSEVERLRDMIAELCEIQPIASVPLMLRILQSTADAPLHDENILLRAPYSPYEIAYALDTGDGDAEYSVRYLLSDTTESQRITKELISGVLLSHREELHERITRLPFEKEEELRRALCESVSLCTKTGLCTVLRAIREQNLLRFPHVRHAVAAWLGVDGTDTVIPSVALMEDCLTDPDKCARALESEDALTFLTALWALGCESAALAVDCIQKTILEGSPQKVMAAGSFCLAAALPHLTYRLAADAVRRHHAELSVMAVWLPYVLSKKNGSVENCFASDEELLLYLQALRSLYRTLADKKKSDPPADGLPWRRTSIGKQDVAEAICLAASASENPDVIDSALPYIKECGIQSRSLCLELLTAEIRTHAQRQTVLECIGNREESTRLIAIKKAEAFTLTDNEVIFLENLLRYKSIRIRQAVISHLIRLDDEGVRNSFQRLSRSGKEELRLGAQELAEELTRSGRSSLAQALMPERISVPPFPAKTECSVSPTAEILEEEAFAAYHEIFFRYFPDSEFRFTNGTATRPRAQEDLRSLSAFIHRHRTDSIRCEEGILSLPRCQLLFRSASLDAFPFAPLWDQWYEQNRMTTERLLRARILSLAMDEMPTAVNHRIASFYGEGFDMRCSIPYDGIARHVLRYLTYRIPEKERRALAVSATARLAMDVPSEKLILKDISRKNPLLSSKTAPTDAMLLSEHPQIRELCQALQCENHESIRVLFPLIRAFTTKQARAIEEYARSSQPLQADKLRFLHSPFHENGNASHLHTGSYLIAAYRGAIPESRLYEYLSDPATCKDAIALITEISAHGNASVLQTLLGKKENLTQDDLDLIAYIKGIGETLSLSLMKAELARSRAPSAYSFAVSGIRYLGGAQALAELLAATSANDFVRAAKDDGNGRADNLCRLLSVCAPTESDGVQSLTDALRERRISDERLMEAAFCAPAWCPLISEALRIPDSEAAVCFLRAWMDEPLDTRQKSIVAERTRLTDAEWKSGVFDVAWFRELLQQLGNEAMTQLHLAAERFAKNKKQKNALQCIRAAMGICDIRPIEQSLWKKHATSLLNVYALIPLADEEELVRRYLLLWRLREQNGADVTDIAIRSLAANAGFSHAIRLTLRMEAIHLRESALRFEPKTVENITVSLTIGTDGRAKFTATRDGAVLKALPSHLKRHASVLAMKARKEALDAQYRETVRMIEHAIGHRTAFTVRELADLQGHPVAAPLIRATLFQCGELFGFPCSEGLRDLHGVPLPVAENATAFPAHPIHLRQSELWREHRERLERIQEPHPICQASREAYAAMEYCGERIRLANAMPILAERGWRAAADEGWQKSYPSENLIVRLHVFREASPPDAPGTLTIRSICFIDRKTKATIPSNDVPAVIFSEVMRDIALISR